MKEKMKIEIKGTLFEENDSVMGLFHIINGTNIIPIKIGIDKALLRVWGIDGDADYGNALSTYGFLMVELMFLSNNVRDYTLTLDNFPQAFQKEKGGFSLLTSSLKQQILEKKLQNN